MLSAEVRIYCKECQERTVPPSRVKQRTYICSQCLLVRGITRRTRIFDTSFVECLNHPGRRVNRSFYIRTGCRFCASCHIRRSNGQLIPSMIRRKIKYNRLRKYKSTGKQPRYNINGHT